MTIELSHRKGGEMLLRWLDADGKEVNFQYLKVPVGAKGDFPMQGRGADAASQLARIEGLTFSDCLRFFDDQASERDQAVAALAPTREGEVEVDHAIISEGDDNGAYVLAWVWADFADTPFDKEPTP